MAKIAFSVPPEPEWEGGVTMPNWKPDIHVTISDMTREEFLRFCDFSKVPWISGTMDQENGKVIAFCHSADFAAAVTNYAFEENILPADTRRTTMLALDETCREFLKKTTPART